MSFIHNAQSNLYFMFVMLFKNTRTTGIPERMKNICFTSTIFSLHLLVCKNIDPASLEPPPS